MAIDTLPLNANGKVDRKALPSPAEPAPAADGGEPPRPGVETVIATAWQDLLYLEEVTRTDDFLALGGNSLLATELVLRLRRQDVEVDIAELMRAATLADLAAPPRRSGTETGTS